LDPQVREGPKLDHKKDIHYRIAEHVHLAEIPDQEKSVNISQNINSNNLFEKVSFNVAISKVTATYPVSSGCVVRVSLALIAVFRNVAFISEIYYMVRRNTNKYVSYAKLARDQAQDSWFSLGKACVPEDWVVKYTKSL
jgi:hypothetical protein